MLELDVRSMQMVEKSSKIRLVIDNTNVIKKQPFKQPVVVTRDELKHLRQGFTKWLNEQ